MTTVLITFLAFITQQVSANVNPLEGSFEFALNHQGYQLQYSSRSLKISKFGLGWELIKENPSKNISIHVTGHLLKKFGDYSFKYDKLKNLVLIHSPLQKMKISYDPNTDTVSEIVDLKTHCRNQVRYQFIETSTNYKQITEVQNSCSSSMVKVFNFLKTERGLLLYRQGALP
jgi:hypothetical protein